MTDVRYIAYEALLSAPDGEYSGSLAKDVLDKYSYLESNDKAFLKRLIEGTIERRETIEYVLDLYSKVPVKKMKKQVRCLLRMGTYQLLYMDGVSDYAAANETVKIIKKTGLRDLSGFVNGVLRQVARNSQNIKWPDKDEDPVGYMSVMYSCPSWIVKMLIDEQGEASAKKLLELSVSVRDITARVNTSKTTVDKVLAVCDSTSSDVFENAVILNDRDDIASLAPLADGLICIQDISSMLVCHVAGIKEDDTVLDLCAAPGGKSMHAADMAVKGKVISCDVSVQKTQLIEENARRCGFSNVTVCINDAAKLNSEFIGSADVVIADVPCSGLGVMGRKNDIKYNITKGSIEELSALQKRILKNAASYVKPGGVLMFSTCTCTKEENNDNFVFLESECGLRPEGFYEKLPLKLRDDTAKLGYIQLVGDKMLTDGFFIGKFRK